MKATVTILSGSRHGQTYNVFERGFRIGGDGFADIAFDLNEDPGADSKLVILSSDADRWYLQNQSVGAIFLNHDLVVERANLRSGDLIRLSHDGPDLLFEIVTPAGSDDRFSSNSDTTSGKDTKSFYQVSPRSTALSNTTDSIQDLNYLEGEAEGVVSFGSDSVHRPLVPSDAPHRLSSVKKRSHKQVRKRGSKLSPMIGVLSIFMGGIAGSCIAVLVLWVVWRKDPLGMIDIIQSGPTVESPTNDGSDHLGVSSGDVEQDGVKDSVSADRTINLKTSLPEQNELSQSKAMSGLSTSVDESVTLPELKKIEQQEFDLSRVSRLELGISDYLIGQPNEYFTYRLSGSSPDGVTLDQETGVLRWEVPKSFAGKDVRLSFTVAHKNHLNALTEGVVIVKPFFSDAWDLIGQQIASSTYLIVTKAEPGDRFLALGTGCAIDSNQLLSSATVAQGISSARKRGWDVFAVCHAELADDATKKIEIGQQKYHRMYLDASSKTDSTLRRTQEAFFDLALIETQQALGSILPIGLLNGGEQDAASVGCFGYSINGKLATNLQDLRPEFTMLDLLGTFPPQNASLDQGRPPLLLELEGEMPVHTYGGLLINATMELVGIYGFEGAADKADDLKQLEIPVHYASELLPVKLFLNDQETDLWILK